MDEKTLFNNLIKHFLEIKTRKDMEDLLLGILTPTEREELPRRLEIVKRLLRQNPHAQIAKDMGLGVATVTRGSRELKLNHFKALQRKYAKKNKDTN